MRTEGQRGFGPCGLGGHERAAWRGYEPQLVQLCAAGGLRRSFRGCVSGASVGLAVGLFWQQPPAEQRAMGIGKAGGTSAVAPRHCLGGLAKQARRHVPCLAAFPRGLGISRGLATRRFLHPIAQSIAHAPAEARNQAQLVSQRSTLYHNPRLVCYAPVWPRPSRQRSNEARLRVPRQPQRRRTQRYFGHQPRRVQAQLRRRGGWCLVERSGRAAGLAQKQRALYAPQLQPAHPPN